MREILGGSLGAIAGGGFWGVFGGVGLVGAGTAVGLGLAPLIGIGAVVGLAGAGISRFFD